MPRQATQQMTFAEHLQQVLQELAMAEVAPGADVNLVGQLRQVIISSLQNQSAPTPPGAPQTLAVPPGGMPVTPADMSRGPVPGPDTAGFAGDLASILGGAPEAQA